MIKNIEQKQQDEQAISEEAGRNQVAGQNMTSK